jgi:hypothetical protein
MSKGTSALQRENRYFPRPMPASLSKAGLRATPLLVMDFVTEPVVAEPVVVPGFMLDLLVSVPALPSLDAPGAGCICADAIAVAPNSEAIRRAKIASLQRMGISSFDQ